MRPLGGQRPVSGWPRLTQCATSLADAMRMQLAAIGNEQSVSKQQVSAGSARARAIAVLVAGLAAGTYLFWVQANSGLLFVASQVDHLGGDGVCAWFRVEATHAGDSGVGVARLVGGASTRGGGETIAMETRTGRTARR
jgi:hypothetical protein